MGSLPAQTCPCCSRSWTPTPFDDCFVPACGCFGAYAETLEAGLAPCEACGISHALRCENLPGRKREPGDLVKVVEVGGPLGAEVIRPSLRVRET